MGRNWRPKYECVCPKCGWTGKRVAVAAFCPRGCDVRCAPPPTQGPLMTPSDKEMAHSGFASIPSELVERLENASAGSRELNGLVCGALGVLDQPEAHGSSYTYSYPRVTTSLDATLALAERVCPDHEWSIGHLPRSADADHEPHHRFGVLLYSQGTKARDALSHGATPALTLCIAILKAATAASQAPGGDERSECTKKEHDNEG